jgi:ribosomal protein L40E
MSQPALSLQEQPAAPKANSPTGLFLQPWQKAGLLIVLLGILYLRSWRRKQARTQICSHCGKKNPAHQSNCQKCAAPLMRVDRPDS